MLLKLLHQNPQKGKLASNPDYHVEKFPRKGPKK